MIDTVIKRNEDQEKFDILKISKAIKAASPDRFWINKENELAYLAEEVKERIDEDFSNTAPFNDVLPTVEAIQDIVEETLMDNNYKKIAKSYILYREEKNKLRNKPWLEGDMAKDIWKRKYQKNGETFKQFFERVISDKKTYDKHDKVYNYLDDNQKATLKHLKEHKFCPAGRILANKNLNNVNVSYSNCYFIPIENDNLESIYKTAYQLARTFSYGGGSGSSLSALRPRGAKVNNAAKQTTGSVSFAELYNTTTGLIGQAGRRGALLLDLDIYHPDIIEFIEMKLDPESTTKANISVKTNKDFFESIKANKDFTLKFYVEDHDEWIQKKIDPNVILNKIAYANWYSGEPGMLYWDRVNNWSLVSNLDTFEYGGTNPCGELPQPDYGSCNLSSINLSELVDNKFTDDANIDEKLLIELTNKGIKYLDHIVDENKDNHPLPEQTKVTAKFRQLGLGVMGMADMLIKLGIRYGSEKHKLVSKRLGKIMLNEAFRTSVMLAKENGPFPAYKPEMLDAEFIQQNIKPEYIQLAKKHGLRNASLLSIAPTGSISSMFGVSGGIEPIFAISYTRKTESMHSEDKTYKVFTPIVRELMDAKNIYLEEDLPDYVVSAEDIDYKDRVDVQAAWQEYIDNAISSTVNLPNSATVDDIKDLYMYGFEKGLKGLTTFRDGCARAGILTTDKDKDTKVEMEERDWIEIGVCPECQANLNPTQGCNSCPTCGWSACSV